MTQNIKYFFSFPVMLYFVTAFIFQGYTDVPMISMAIQLHMLWVLGAVLLRSEKLTDTFKPWCFISIIVLSVIYHVGLNTL